jgi:hypothetical protein
MLYYFLFSRKGESKSNRRPSTASDTFNRSSTDFYGSDVLSGGEYSDGDPYSGIDLTTKKKKSSSKSKKEKEKEKEAAKPRMTAEERTRQVMDAPSFSLHFTSSILCVSPLQHIHIC